jgi:hypothetical protein
LKGHQLLSSTTLCPIAIRFSIQKRRQVAKQTL